MTVEEQSRRAAERECAISELREFGRKIGDPLCWPATYPSVWVDDYLPMLKRMIARVEAAVQL